ncbi:hypothetical protein K490DRAFT_47844 [Saccharata proteae CBS 121410]|uniref:Xylanolytic transcriptional activator regulatory domain-containing protein n=1 Tax=Saccharata proteae CBS 121410 TaxID=1314787 RepID=A0A9P4LUK9_9PEZI|nr:hypothetical protein K490DRAFT_47844 [Saccharata proteae CBS 121410]
MSSMITFAANNEFFRKRKRVHRACDACKRRRKRCVHTFDGEAAEATEESPTATDSFENTPAPSQQRNAFQVTTQDLPVHGPPDPQPPSALHPSDSAIDWRLTQDDPNAGPLARFVGYLSPEAVMRSQIQEPASKAGGWVRITDDEGASNPPRRTGSQDVVSPGSHPSSRDPNVVERALQAYLDAVGISTAPLDRSVESLLAIYFEYVNPLLPLVNQRAFYDLHLAKKGSHLLLQAICLVASKHPNARTHLYLSDEPRLLEPREYARRLYAAIVATIDHGLERDRIILIQVLALTSLHSEGIDGADQASLHLVQAIHHAHTIGLQFGRQGRVSDDDSLEKLFWALWSMDKLNASLNGRPSYMHDRDNQLESMTAQPDRRRTPFGFWLQMAGLLDRVIELYRPGTSPSETGLETGFPGFEDVIGDAGDTMKGPILAGLELFYHAVAMLSHKSRSINDPVRSTPSAVRQSLSAVRVMEILRTESPRDLPPLPLVPYATSLAMSVAYRQFRRSKLQAHKKRAKEDLKTSCSLLNQLRTTWWCAGCMADLGAAAITKADKPHRRAPDSTIPEATQQTTPGGTRNQYTTPAQLETPSDSTTSPQDLNQLIDGNPGSVPIADILNFDIPSMPGQHPISSERAEQTPTSLYDGGLNDSPEWMNFDFAFERMDHFLGSGGADLSNELKSFNWDIGAEFPT